MKHQRPQHHRGNYADSYGISAEGDVVGIALNPEEYRPSQISIVLNWQVALASEPWLIGPRAKGSSSSASVSHPSCTSFYGYFGQCLSRDIQLQPDIVVGR